MAGVLPQIWLRLITDPGFAARLRSDFAGTLRADGYATVLSIQDLPAVYRWHRALQEGTEPSRIAPPAGMRPPAAPAARAPSPD